LNSKTRSCFKHQRPNQNRKRKMTYYLNSKNRKMYYFHYLMKNAMNICLVKVNCIHICQYALFGFLYMINIITLDLQDHPW